MERQHLLNNGSLSDGPHGGSDVGGSLRESKSVGDGGSDVGGGDGVGDGGGGDNRGGSSSNGGGGSVSSVGRGGVASVGGGVGTGEASVGVAVGEPVGVGHLRVGLSGGGGDSDGENDL